MRSESTRVCLSEDLSFGARIHDMIHDQSAQCKIEFTHASHCVSKNLTPGRMLKKDLLIAKINRWNNSFQNMYDMLQAKWTVWPGKLIL